MAALAEGLLRVRNQILTLRRERELFLAGLERRTKERRSEVSGMLAQFSSEFGEIARQRRSRGRTFLAGLKGEVSSLQQNVKLDSGGAREVFGNVRAAAPAALAQTMEEPDVETHVPHEEMASARDEAEAKVHPASPKKNKELKRGHVVSSRRRRH